MYDLCIKCRTSLGNSKESWRRCTEILWCIASICRITKLVWNVSTTITVNYKILRSNTSEKTARITKACSRIRRYIMCVYITFADLWRTGGIRTYVTRYQIKSIANRIYIYIFIEYTQVLRTTRQRDSRLYWHTYNYCQCNFFITI